MRRIALLAVAVSLFATPALAARSNEAKAVAAVRQEIARRFPLLDTTSKLVNADKARATITCQKLNSTRYTCDWIASNNLHEHASGSARVVVYADAAQATLYDVTCTSVDGC